MMPDITDDLIQFRTEGSVVVATVTRGRFRDEREILSTLERLGEFINGRDGIRLLLNMDKVEYLSSAGLGTLVGLLKKCRQKEGQFKLCCLNESIGELFQVMKLDRIFEIYPDEQSAVESF